MRTADADLTVEKVAGRAGLWTWTRYCLDVLLGVVSGFALIFVSMLVLVGVLYFWALPVGSLLALAIWAVTAIVSTVRMHFRGRNSATIRFLVGFGIIPCYAGTVTIIAACSGGWGNPFIG
ncbi:hypothetical protein [Nocardia yamanashiensis]|uniref:hypothetical protein n=1 Tax=Nocardia yamanashiensis TaxID=209247 RepID=UPI00082ADB62|nr:hypothetical protein [Nocardia yamanashiensis]